MADEAQTRAFKTRLAQAGTDVERLAVLREVKEHLSEFTRDDAKTCLSEMIQVARRASSYDDMVRAGVSLSEILLNAGDTRGCLECLECVREGAKASGDPVHEARLSYMLGRTHQARGNYASAGECYERSLKLWREAAFPRGVAAALNQLATLFGLRGQLAEALEYWQECLKIDDELGDVAQGILHQYNIGWALAQLGRWEDAFESYYRAIAQSERHGMLELKATVLHALGELFLSRDSVSKAIDMFTMVIEAAGRGEALSSSLHESLKCLGVAYHRLGDLTRAGRALEQALQATLETGDRRVTSMVLGTMAELALDRGEFEQCAELAGRSAALAHELGLRREAAQAHRVEGLLLAMRGESEKARDKFEEAVALLQDLEESEDLARVRFHYGRFLLNHGEKAEAVTHLKAASRVFRKLGIVADAQEVNRLLFQQEMRSDSDMALLQGISGLASLGVGPQVLLERAVGLLREALKFDQAAILAQGRPVLVVGNPNLNPVRVLGNSPELVVTDSMLSWPVRYGGAMLGRIYLERATPLAVEHNHLVLDTIANLLAVSIHRLAELSVSEVEEQPGLAGLRYHGMVGRNPRMVEVLTTVCAVAGKSVPVLIRGQSGTGKELIARALHESGDRAGKPFVAVNCAAVPEDLLEAEFFGVEKGAATGVAAHKGKFEAADGGTVFLDEIGDMSPALQAKLLRVLQEQSFERVGGRTPIAVDVRVVAATNQELPELIAQGRFREDLYYRLNTVELSLPSLRERPEDIPGLVRLFIQRSNQEFGRHVAGVSPDVVSGFMVYPWPGNIRELQHVVERSVLLARGDTIQLEDMPPSFQALSQASPSAEPAKLRTIRREAQEKAAADVERAAIVGYLEKAEWNVENAARLAGYSRAQFYRLMQKHSVSRPKS